MNMNSRDLRRKRAGLIADCQGILDREESSGKRLSLADERQYTRMMDEIEQLGTQISSMEMGGNLDLPFSQQGGGGNLLTGMRINDEERAAAQYIRTGDRSGLRDVGTSVDGEYAMQFLLPGAKRAVDSTMNITTAADGGSVVPTGFAGAIAARRNEIRIADRLGVRRVPGQGTTVDFPYENADPNPLAATAEQDDAHAQNYQRDAVVFGKKSFTLVKKSKKLEITEELLDDEDAGLLSFISDHIGRALGITHNAMLLTEVAANGTALKTFAAAAAIAAGEPEDLVYNDTLSYYLDDGGNCGWVMRPTTFGAIASLTGNARLYAGLNLGPRSLVEYPVVYSNSAAAIGASAKSVYFGNWFYVGMREDPALRLIRDPFSTDGLVILKYSFRAVYGVLIAGAIGYGVHPSA